MKKINSVIGYLVLTGFIIGCTIGCAHQEPIRVRIPSPEELPLCRNSESDAGYDAGYSDQFVFKILNGLSHWVIIYLPSDETIEIERGLKEEIVFQRSDQFSQVVLMGRVLSEEGEVIGTIAEPVEIPPRGFFGRIEDFWHITRFKKLKR